MNDDSIEQEIQAKGLTAPHVTREDIEVNIASEHYFTALHGVVGAVARGELRAVINSDGNGVNDHLELLTFCVLTLRNGFTVVGKSACASPENFDADLGREIARNDAVNQMWPLMGYALKEQLSRVHHT